ncbi:polysaccharide deacetylase family protein [Tengunoibacter tsumagoiensis]|uniref:NodB homology domain-containing protein n=1 Tax=Tengunoibacter tsumagoiensis TaxID=2014871 RepID=A0A402A483_9CHLR|nr:polysaccharide deacetylase family protein [Tengunoibacter tsumagoiensis]GCE13948.1 hypothetical protein KTT_38070 [Tengunoibacter tsumagoiensis]
MNKKTPPQARLLVIMARILMICSVALILLSLFLGAYVFLSPVSAAHSSQPLTPTTAQKPKTHPHRPVISASKYQGEVGAITQLYFSALINHQYDVMWSMLHPDIQAQWGSQEAFATYEQKRFQGFTLGTFTKGSVNDLSYWMNPETMTRYNRVEEQAITLQITPAANLATLPIIDQHASDVLTNIPCIVQRASLSAHQGEGNQWYVLNGGPADPEAPLLPPMTPVSQNVNVPILMYHYVSEVPANDPNPELRRSLSVSPTAFSKQLDYLKTQGYHSITFNQLMNALYYGVALPSRPIIFTFDDGYVDAYTGAYPVLRAHGYSGMFYIITGKVGWQGQASWDQLREMLANGMQMGSHTIHHVEIGKTYQNSPEQAQQELEVSQLTMQKQLGMVIQHFCYPNGDPFKGSNVTLQRAITALLDAQGYTDATTDPGPTGVLQKGADPFVLLRLRIDGRSSLNFFIQQMKTYEG